MSSVKYRHIRAVQRSEWRRQRRRRLLLLILILGIIWWLWPKKAPNNQSAAVLSSSPSPTSLTVFLHPGNGGSETGPTYPQYPATGESFVAAKDINLALALAVERALAKEGIAAVLSRTTDTFVDAIDRKERAGQAGAVLAISFYSNSNYQDSALAGWQIINYKDADWPIDYKERRAFAFELDRALTDRIGAPYGLSGLGIYTRNSTFVPDMPTVVLLAGFLTNQVERERLNSEEYQWEIANAVTDAVVYYRDFLLRGERGDIAAIPEEMPLAGARIPF